MSYRRLVSERAIEKVSVSNEELADHLRKARHDISLAQKVADLDLDWGYTIAYNGILQAALTFMYYKGFRPKGEAKHYNTFRFLKAALPKSYSEEINRLQKLRQKRNKAVYQRSGIISEKEARDIISFSAKFLEEITSFMPDNIIKMSKKS